VSKIQTDPLPITSLEVDNWLHKIGLPKYANIFVQYNVDDYLALVFLNSWALEAMGIPRSSPDHIRIIDAVTKMKKLNKQECTFYHNLFPVHC
jgi:hypothetical protein